MVTNEYYANPTAAEESQAEAEDTVAGLTSDNVIDLGETQIVSGLPTALVVLGAVGVAAVFAWWYYR